MSLKRRGIFVRGPDVGEQPFRQSWFRYEEEGETREGKAETLSEGVRKGSEEGREGCRRDMQSSSWRAHDEGSTCDRERLQASFVFSSHF